ncbi:GroES-like protein [Hyphopichia burtonii NRRL Y-1933]|uniref:GroES-like protein n=1 Tax=Hyphopichia burtonii NRRL Y-1933 TaxID=984485 RepID=A0A1E4RBL8_9ASCO|nr:GroES-like protein [Hyphopichia burtonii NRRL Y-1933]ODV64662.1 GroES-like protein [Hyphopichia burtonii NRRL Y-1933]
MTVDIPAKFQGFGVHDKEHWSEPKFVEYTPKKVLPHDVVLKNICNGLCGTDIHTLKANWSPLKRDDLVVGHEIIGTVIAVGDEVTQVKVGDRVGIGACASSCRSCTRCQEENEQYCHKSVSTYNSIDHFADNYVTQGGYASHSIANEQFVFPIPDGLDSVSAAPLMCAGLTVYSPIVRNLKKIGKKEPVVGIIGLGGLGHLAVQFASALGAKVTVFSRSNAKKDEAFQLGGHEFIATGVEKDWTTKYQDNFDFILNCASGIDGLNLNDYLSVLKVDGRFVSVGLPPVKDTFEVTPFSFLKNAGSFGSSLLGSKAEALEMLQLAADKGIKPWVEEIPISEKAVNEALNRCDQGDVRYRFVFTDYDKAFTN